MAGRDRISRDLMRGAVLIPSVARKGSLKSAQVPAVRTAGRLQGETP